MMIHQTINAGKFPNATTLSREAGVSPKTIRRDLDFMRDRLDLPIDYDEIAHGYFYTEEVSAFPSMQITEGELFALLVAEKALQQYRGSTFEKPLVSAFKKIAESLPDTVSLNLQEWDQSISFRTSAVPVIDLQMFDRLAKATTRKDQLEIVYRKPGAGEGVTRTIDPLQLANINGEWFLFAYDHLRKDLRTFAPARIQSLKSTGKQFKRPKKFSLENRLRSSFGVITGGETQEILIEFSPYAADFIREKNWHPTQKIKDQKSGGIELTLTLSSFAEVQRWILSWGGHAIAKKPRALVEALKDDAKRILKNH